MTNDLSAFDVAVVGAGLAGLICAKQLQHRGLKVVILEKSRGVGGRVATRRLHHTCVDHGLPYLERQGQRTQNLIEQLCQGNEPECIQSECGLGGLPHEQLAVAHKPLTVGQQNVIQSWTGNIYQWQPQQKLKTVSPTHSYIAPSGMSVIAKFLATDLAIWREWRVKSLTPTPEQTWQLIGDTAANFPNLITAKAVVLAIPAPQALILLESSPTNLSWEFNNTLRAVEFDPCLAVIAGYPPERQQEFLQLNPTWQAVRFSGHSDLAWIGLDSSKRSHPQQPVFVFHSTAQFAQDYLEATDLEAAGQKLLNHAAQILLTWLDSPDWFQVHRWRYAFPRHPLATTHLLLTQPLPLVCCGDWCAGNGVESALNSGLAAAAAIGESIY